MTDIKTTIEMRRSIDKLFHVVDGARVAGPHGDIRGDVIGLYGDCTKIHGDAGWISGHVSWISGDVSGIRGDATRIEADVDCIPSSARPCDIADFIDGGEA